MCLTYCCIIAMSRVFRPTHLCECSYAPGSSYGTMQHRILKLHNQCLCYNTFKSTCQYMHTMSYYTILICTIISDTCNVKVRSIIWGTYTYVNQFIIRRIMEYRCACRSTYIACIIISIAKVVPSVRILAQCQRSYLPYTSYSIHSNIM